MLLGVLCIFVLFIIAMVCSGGSNTESDRTHIWGGAVSSGRPGGRPMTRREAHELSRAEWPEKQELSKRKWN